MKNLKTYIQLNEGSLIQKKNMDIDEFKSVGTFFNREPHTNESPVHNKSIDELNEDRKNDMSREILNIIQRYKTKMDGEEIIHVLTDLIETIKQDL